MFAKSILCGAFVAAVAHAQSTSNLTAVLNSTSSLSALNSLIGDVPGLASSLASASNVTILAPSNEAISAFLNTTEGKMAAADSNLITAVLQYHMLNGTYYASNVTSTPAFIPTMLTNTTYSNVTGGQVVEAMMMDGQVMFLSALKANATVTQANLNFTGGVVHVIDSLLSIPGNITYTLEQANLTALDGAVVNELHGTSLVDDLADVTIFAPNNDAFAAIGSALANLTVAQLTSVLEYHIINGTVAYSSDISNMTMMTLGGSNVTLSVINGSIYVDSAKVTVPDVLVAGGVVHIIDAVLNPNNTSASPNPSTTMVAFAGASSAGSSVPYTSGVATPSSTAAGLSAASSAAATATGGSGGSGGSTSSSSAGASLPMKTGAIGAAALFGGAMVAANW